MMPLIAVGNAAMQHETRWTWCMAACCMQQAATLTALSVFCDLGLQEAVLWQVAVAEVKLDL